MFGADLIVGLNHVRELSIYGKERGGLLSDEF